MTMTERFIQQAAENCERFATLGHLFADAGKLAEAAIYFDLAETVAGHAFELAANDAQRAFVADFYASLGGDA